MLSRDTEDLGSTQSNKCHQMSTNVAWFGANSEQLIHMWLVSIATEAREIQS